VILQDVLAVGVDVVLAGHLERAAPDDVVEGRRKMRYSARHSLIQEWSPGPVSQVVDLPALPLEAHVVMEGHDIARAA